MPIDYKNYPPNWKTEIRPRILARAKHRCENCGIPNYFIFPGGGKVILTISHKDRDPENFDVKDERLQALCQACHLDYDKHANTAARKYGKNYNGIHQLKIEL